MLSTKHFDYNPSTKTLSAECSELPSLFGKEMIIKSEHTGKVVRFVLNKKVKDSEGDIVAWEYKPAPGLALNVRILIWND